MKKGVFREDLYHRIYVFPLSLPPLRERDGEIPALVAHFAAQVCEVNGWKPKVFLPEAIQELQRYSWPGNVRELRNVVERLLLLADGAVDAALVRLALPAGEGERTGDGGGAIGIAGGAHGCVRAGADSGGVEAASSADDGYREGAGVGAESLVQEVPGAGDRFAGDAEWGDLGLA